MRSIVRHRRCSAALAVAAIIACGVAPGAAAAPHAAGPPDLHQTDAQWQYDEAVGCWVFIPHQWGPLRGFGWSGPCAASRASGMGVLRVDLASGNSVTADGLFRDGRFQRGVFIGADGARAEGVFRNGLLQGNGTVRFRGYPYGYWRAGKYVRSSSALLNGTSVRGMFRDGKLNGEGTIAYVDGTIITGTFADGRLNGQGTIRYARGGGITGQFVDGALSGQGAIDYEDGSRMQGQFAQGKLNGAGALVSADGARVEGEFRDGGLVHGTWQWADGSRFEGTLVAGRFDGAATLIWPGGARFEGRFRDGLEEGPASFRMDDGSVLECEYRAGAIIGDGVLRRPDGTEIRGKVAAPRPDPRHSAARPNYPPISIRLNEEGRVVIRYYVTTDGLVRSPRVLFSSGKLRLDYAALISLAGQRRLPGTIAGKPIAVSATQTFTFKLDAPRHSPPPALRRK